MDSLWTGEKTDSKRRANPGDRLAEALQLLAGTLQGFLQLGVVANDGDLDGARGHKVLPYGGGMKVRMVLVVIACLLLATACGSSEPELDMSQAAIADRVEEYVKSATTTVAWMSLADAYCSDLEKGMSPLQIWGGVKDDWPDVGDFANRAYGWVKRKCPSELKSNELLRYWLENWNINPDA